jgi:HNH endonuclease
MTDWRHVESTAYEVNALGQVRHYKTKRLRKLYQHKSGYLVFTGGPAARRISYKVHRLVARAFLGPCPAGKQVNHRDGNKGHNIPENLEYVTHKENGVHAGSLGLMARGDRHRSVRLTAEQVQEIRTRYRFKEPSRSAPALAREFGVAPETIAAILKRRSWAWL